MRKLLVFFSGLIGVVLLLIPGLVGWAVSRFHAQLVSQLDRNWPNYSVVVESFEQGWFSSNLVLRLTPVGSGRALRLENRIAHGLFTPTPGWLRGQGPLRAPDSGELGQLNWHLTPALDLNARLDLLPSMRPSGQLAIELGEFGDTLDFRVTNFSHEGLEGLAARGRLELSRGSGDISLQIPLLRQPGWQLEALDWQVEYQRSNEFYQVLQAWKADGVKVEGLAQPFGPSSLQLDLQRLHGPSLASALGAGPDALPFALPLLLNYQPGLVVDELALTHPDGGARFTGQLALIAPPPGGWLVEPGRLLEVSRGQGSTRISAALLRQLTALRLREQGLKPDEMALAVDAVLGSYIERGLLKADGNELVNQWQLESGVLTVNDREQLGNLPGVSP